MIKKSKNGLMIKLYRLHPNPLPDFQHQPIKEPLAVEIDNETLKEIVKYTVDMRGEE